MIYNIFLFFVLKYLFNPPLHVPSICKNLVCFKVQVTRMTHDTNVHLGRIVYSNLYTND